jgi:pSer/pThr/pTyr-binding forkhead associated (FHA) protein
METRTCSVCGYANLPGEQFCKGCGVQLAPLASTPPPLPSKLPLSTSSTSPPLLPPSLEQPARQLVLQDTRQALPLPAGKTELILGRADVAEEFFPDLDLNPYGGEAAGVSRRHARLSLEAGKVYLEDLNSTNFTFINQQTLFPGKRYLLKSGDEIQLGRLNLEYVSEHE